MAPAQVHRPLLLATPIESGEDVRVLQRRINARFEDLRIDRQIAEDGEFGRQTYRAAFQVAVGMGVHGDAARKLRRGRLSMGTQKLIRKDRRQTRAEGLLAKSPRRRLYRRKLRRRYAKSAGEKAVAFGRRFLGVHEEPAGSNWGGMVEKFIRFTGYTFPVYWCGCYAAYVIVKGGGARIPERIRIGYALYITADAQAGRNGLEAVPASQARPGDLVCLWGGQHIEIVAEHVSSTTVLCLGGNTSTAGRSNNGGEVCANRRSLSDFDAGIVARPHYA